MRNNHLTKQELRLYEMLSRRGRYTVPDITREFGQCNPRGYISRMRRKGMGLPTRGLSVRTV